MRDSGEVGVTLQNVIHAVQARLVRNRVIVTGIILGGAVSLAALLGFAAGLLNFYVGVAVFLLLTTAAVLYAWRAGLFDRPLAEDACAVLDAAFTTKDRALTWLSLAEEKDTARRALIEHQLGALLPEVDVAAVAPLRLSRNLRLVALAVPLVWGILIVWTVLWPREELTGEPALGEARLVADLLLEQRNLPLPLREELIDLANTLKDNPLTSAEVEAALAAAEAELEEADVEGEETSGDDPASTLDDDEAGEEVSRPDGVSVEPTPTPTPAAAATNEAAEAASEKEKREQESGGEGSEEEPGDSGQKESKENNKEGGESKGSKDSTEQKDRGDQGEKGDQGDKDQPEKPDSNTDVQNANSSGTDGEAQDKPEGGKGQEQGEGGEQQKQEPGGDKGQQGEQGQSGGEQGDGDGQGAQGSQPGQGGQSGQSGQAQGGESGQSDQGNKEGAAPGAGGQSSGEQPQDQGGSKGGEQQGSSGGEGGAPQQGGQSAMDRVKETLDQIRERQQGGSGQGEGGRENPSEKSGGGSGEKPAEAALKTNPEPGTEQGGKPGEKPAEKPQAGADPQAATSGGDDQRDEQSSNQSGQSPASSSSLPSEQEQRSGGELPEGESGGLKGEKGYQDAEVRPSSDERFDPRFTGKKGELARNTKEARVKTKLEDVQLARPEPIKGGEDQPIPLEYRDLIE